MKKGNKLRELRLRKFLTLDDIYIQSKRKLDQSRVSKLERDIILPTERDKKLLSKIFNVPSGEIFPETEQDAGVSDRKRSQSTS